MNDSRVRVKPYPLSKGMLAQVGYRGLLANSGADRVFLHYGRDGWQDPRTVEMKRRTDGGFAVSIMSEGERFIDMCFKDSADHWDNNGGNDWRFSLRK